jgi:hypothetical protein
MESTIKGVNTRQLCTSPSYLVDAIEERGDLKRLIAYGRNNCAVFFFEKGYFFGVVADECVNFCSCISSA